MILLTAGGADTAGPPLPAIRGDRGDRFIISIPAIEALVGTDIGEVKIAVAPHGRIGKASKWDHLENHSMRVK